MYNKTVVAFKIFSIGKVSLPRDKTCNHHEHRLDGEMLIRGTLEACVHAEATDLVELNNRIVIRIHWK